MKKGNEVNSTSDLVKAHTLPNVGHTGEERWEELWEDFWMIVQIYEHKKYLVYWITKNLNFSVLDSVQLQPKVWLRGHKGQTEYLYRYVFLMTSIHPLACSLFVIITVTV